MKKGDHVMVLTSSMYADKVGVVKEITNMGRVTIQFGPYTGFYTIGRDTFKIIKEYGTDHG